MRGLNIDDAGCHSSGWRTLALQLMPFLKTRRNWVELLSWGRQNRVSEMSIRGVLAWLALQKIIFPTGAGNNLCWHLRTVHLTGACSTCNAFVVGTTCALCGNAEISLSTDPTSEPQEISI
jgi:hypothetical protein